MTTDRKTIGQKEWLQNKERIKNSEAKSQWLTWEKKIRKEQIWDEVRVDIEISKLSTQMNEEEEADKREKKKSKKKKDHEEAVFRSRPY